MSIALEGTANVSRPSTLFRQRSRLSYWFLATPLVYGAFAVALVLERPVAEDQHYQGAVLTLHDNKLYVLGQESESYTFELVSDTTIMIDGVPSKPSELKTGLFVNVVARNDDSRLLAKWIDAYRQGSPIAKSD